MKRILLVLLGTTLGLLAGEVLLRALHLPHFPDAKALRHTGGLQLYRSSSLSYPMHRLIPYSTYTHVYSDNPRGYFGDGNEITITANNRGFRGGTFDDGRPPGIFKIVFLGDSLTLGEGVKFEDTYPEVISRQLNADPGRPGRVVSYNYGMLAYNTTQEYLILLEEALSMRPDMVVLGYFLNDADGPFAYEDPVTGEIVQAGFNPFDIGVGERPPPRLIYRSRALQLAWQIGQRRRISERTLSYYDGLYGEHQPHLTTNRESLRSIVRLCEKNGIPLVIACIPVLHRLDTGYPFQRIHALIEEVVTGASSGRTTFVDLLPSFRGQDPRRLWVHATDHHPNERAHLIIARSLLDVIKNRVLTTAPSPEVILPRTP